MSITSVGEAANLKFVYVYVRVITGYSCGWLRAGTNGKWYFRMKCRTSNTDAFARDTWRCLKVGLEDIWQRDNTISDIFTVIFLYHYSGESLEYRIFQRQENSKKNNRIFMEILFPCTEAFFYRNFLNIEKIFRKENLFSSTQQCLRDTYGWITFDRRVIDGERRRCTLSGKVIKVDSQKDESICIPRYCIFMVS